jgi:putative endonuclease
MEKQPCVYILASRPNGTLYVGVTSNLIGRVYQHRQKLIPGFTKRYNISDLVWYEIHEQMESAILREKQLKNWSRVAKKRLIEMSNPTWQDLSPDIGLPSMATGSRHSLPG